MFGGAGVMGETRLFGEDDRLFGGTGVMGTGGGATPSPLTWDRDDITFDRDDITFDDTEA